MTNLGNKTLFAMAFHCYQPVFNFDFEIERAFRNAYLPLIEVLTKFPHIKATLHYSGNMLEWFERNHPDYIEKVKILVRREQIELIGGGWFEPIMALIPEPDRQDQLRINNEIITRIFNLRVNGTWVTERVWEKNLIETLSSMNIRYTILDDYHLLKARVKKKDIFRPFKIGKGNKAVVLFPALTYLRYAIPFYNQHAVLSYIRKFKSTSQKNIRCFFFADDGEKFGLWPHTYHWVYKRKWLENFFLLLKANSNWLETRTYSEILEQVPAKHIENLPEISYSEMMEWSGGNFKNFLHKYPEINRMHKRMMSVSALVSRVSAKPSIIHKRTNIYDVKKELFKSQSNCAYWHGTFGGVYLPHLRSGVYKHLLKAEELASLTQRKEGSRIYAAEWDFTNSKEIIMGNSSIGAFVTPSQGGWINELDYKPLLVNLINTVSRVKEDYHKKLEKGYSSKIKEARRMILCGKKVDIHDVLGVKERGLKRILSYDSYRRASFMTHIFNGLDKKSCGTFLVGPYKENVKTSDDVITYVLAKRSRIPFGSSGQSDFEVVKNISISTGPAIMLSHRFNSYSKEEILFKFSVEFNFLIWDEDGMKAPRRMRRSNFSLKDRYSGLEIDFLFDRVCTIYTYPIYTVNETERGLGKTFQGISLLVGNECKLDGHASTDEMKTTIAINV